MKNSANPDPKPCPIDLHRNAPVVDAHCDTTQRLMSDQWDFSTRHETGHIDIPRMREGGVGAVFLAIWAAGPLEPGKAVAAARVQFDRISRAVARHAHHLVAARTAADVRRTVAEGRIAILTAVEGGYLIEDSLDVLGEYHRLGATYLTLTHAFHTSWADSSGIDTPLEPRHGGLTKFGKDVVGELNRLGMMVDVSHVSDDTIRDVIEVSVAPIVATHSSCRAVSPHIRNLTDDMLRAIAATGGVIHINFAAGFIDPDFPPIDPEKMQRWLDSGCSSREPLTDHVTPSSVLVDHFEHALRIVGPDHVGIGSDFDGVPALPEGMEDCSKLPRLTAELIRRGHSEDVLLKVLGGNTLRVLEDCQARAEVSTRSIHD